MSEGSRSCGRVGLDRGEFDLHAAAGVREALHFEEGAGGTALAEMTVADDSKFGEVGDVGEVGLRADDVGETHAGLSEDRGEQAENKFGLRGGVVRRDDSALRVEGKLAGDEKQRGGPEIDADGGLAGGRDEGFFMTTRRRKG